MINAHMKNIVRIINVIVILITPLIMIYLSMQLIYWYNTIEGPCSFGFITFMKSASYEVKLGRYNEIMFQSIDILRSNSPHLANFIEKSNSVLNPSASTIMDTSYNQIPSLVEKNIDIEIEVYKKILETQIPLGKTTTGFFSSDQWYYIKWGLIITTVLFVFGVYDFVRAI